MRMRAGWMLGITVVAGAMSVGASRAQAQGTGVDSTPYVRAREMVANGETEAGRHLVDSLLKAAQPGSPEYAEGLYWRAAIAASGRDAERDYRQIVVDYPTSPRVAPALLRMGQLEAARGDREASLQHFQRLVIEHPESPLRAEASYWVANSYLGKNDLQHGCTANADALEHVSANDVELKNRIDYQQLRCRNVRLAGAPTAAPAAAPVITAPPKPVAKTIGKPGKKTAEKSAEKAAPVTKESTAVTREVPVERPVASAESTATAQVRDTAPAHDSAVAEKPAEKPAAAESATVLPSVMKTTKTTATRTTKTTAKTAAKSVTKGATRATEAAAPAETTATAPELNERGYAVQVAAYKSRVQADSLAAKLRARGYASHVDGAGAPYRVRIGHYAKRADAVAELRRLKAKKIDGFVTEP